MAGKLKQATLSSLRGVVIIEDILRHKAILEDQSEEHILSSIAYLKKKTPCKEVLSSTKIINVVEQLTHHSSKEIASEAQSLFDKWKLHAKGKTQPTIEVRYDNLTGHIRRTSLKYFIKELGGQEEDEKIANLLEREIFNQNHLLTSKAYQRTSRKVVFVLRHNEKEREALKHKKISPLDFVIKYRR